MTGGTPIWQVICLLFFPPLFFAHFLLLLPVVKIKIDFFFFFFFFYTVASLHKLSSPVKLQNRFIFQRNFLVLDNVVIKTLLFSLCTPRLPIFMKQLRRFLEVAKQHTGSLSAAQRLEIATYMVPEVRGRV